MWTVEDIKARCQEMSDIVGDTFDCPVRINSRLTRTLGRVDSIKCNGHWENEVLQISKQLLSTSTDECIKSVIDHEWAHYYATKSTGENHGHDTLFREICAKIGCTNDGTKTHVDRTVASNTIYKYQVYCSTCDDFIAGYSRMCSTLKNLKSCTCKKCHTNNLTLIQNW